jgi:hypothetical protein
MSDDGALSPASAASKLDSFILEDDELRQVSVCVSACGVVRAHCPVASILNVCQRLGGFSQIFGPVLACTALMYMNCVELLLCTFGLGGVNRPQSLA